MNKNLGSVKGNIFAQFVKKEGKINVNIAIMKLVMEDIMHLVYAI
jgi:hypothetical protein